MSSLKKRWWLLVIGAIGAAIAGFVIWGETPLPAMPEAVAALQSNDSVRVSAGRWWVFEPVGGQPSTGLIFYPGARVDPRAYAPAMSAIAAKGYLAVVTPMPLNLAVLAPGAANDVIKAYPTIRHWAIAGHSLGGAMAADYVKQHPSDIQGLALWAAYPASSDDLSQSSIHVISLYGTRDGLATQAKIDASRPLLPNDTQFTAIEGGNHAQFGWYGAQPGDNPASISREQQQAQTIEAMITFLEQLDR